MLRSARRLARTLLTGRFSDEESTLIRVTFTLWRIVVGTRVLPGKSGPRVYVDAAVEGRRYLIVDLGHCRFIRTVRLSALPPPRASGIAAESLRVSVDAERWIDATALTDRAASSSGAGAFEFVAPIVARYIAVDLKCLRHRPSQSVEIEQLLPPVKFGGLTDLSVNAGALSCVYQSTHTFGLFSNCSTSLADLIRLEQAGIAVERIDFSRGMTQFKDDATQDVYPVFFEARPDAAGGVAEVPRFDAQIDNHRLYKDVPLARLHAVAQRYFWPSKTVLDAAQELSRKAALEPDHTLAVYCRGTDKGQEIALASTDDYIAAIEALDRRSSTRRDLLVQTDQEQILTAMRERFGERVRSFDSIPTTRGNVAIHNLDLATEFKLSRERFAIEVIAAVFLMAQCAEIITSTSNVALWIAIYRGSARGIHQFDAQGKLVAPET